MESTFLPGPKRAVVSDIAPRFAPLISAFSTSCSSSESSSSSHSSPSESGSEYNPFSPPYWAEDGAVIYEDEVTTTINEFIGSTHQEEMLEKTAFSRPIVSDSEIRTFLNHTDIYDHHMQRWEGVPEVCTNVRQLFTPIRAIMDTLVRRFFPSRPIMDSFHIPAHRLVFTRPQRSPYRTAPLKRLPHMSVLGLEGSNFGSLASVSERGLSYTAMISPVELQIDSQRNFLSDFAQLAHYARNCFLRQHNRLFVYAVLITESVAQLYVFDRSGAYHSQDFDIHKHPVDFIRMMLGVWSPYDNEVGFDTSVYWEKDGHGAWHRYIRSLTEEGFTKIYRLAKPFPIYIRWWIVGRATTVWSTIVNGQRLLIKEAWPDVSRDREWEYLDSARGLRGVGQIIAMEDGLYISLLRKFEPEDSSYVDRQFSRIIVPDYGSRTIDKFRNKADLLYGLRDAIIGHQNLWNNGILHGDVNRENILLLSPESPSDERGVLIDLDLAMWVIGSPVAVNRGFHKYGMRMYQSVNVLESHRKPRANFSRDYLDDLESFYYLLVHICSTFTAPGEQPLEPDFIEEWENGSEEAAVISKMSNLLYPSYRPTPYFGPVFEMLLEKLRAFCAQAVGRKLADLTRRDGAGLPAPTWDELGASAKKDYDMVLLAVDEAIAEIEHESPKVVLHAEVAHRPVEAVVEEITVEPETEVDADEGYPTHSGLLLHPMTMFY